MDDGVVAKLRKGKAESGNRLSPKHHESRLARGSMWSEAFEGQSDSVGTREDQEQETLIRGAEIAD